MNRKPNIIGICLLATFLLIFGSVLSMALFSEGEVATSVSVDAVAKPATE